MIIRKALAQDAPELTDFNIRMARETEGMELILAEPQEDETIRLGETQGNEDLFMQFGVSVDFSLRCCHIYPPTTPNLPPIRNLPMIPTAKIRPLTAWFPPIQKRPMTWSS